MNTFKRISLGVILAFVAGALFVIGSPAEASAAPRVKASVCKTLVYKHGWRKRQCKRQGWFYDSGYTYDGTRYALVVGPRGRVWVDTLNQLGNIR